MATKDIRLGVGGFDCEKVGKIIFFANAFLAKPQTPRVKKCFEIPFSGISIWTAVN
jgi:hypothetical protein